MVETMQTGSIDSTEVITVETAGTLDGLFRERVRRSPSSVAYRDYDRSSGKWRNLTWAQMDERIAHWEIALRRECLAPGERVAVMLRNCPEWVMYEHAAMRQGLVVVPLYTADRPENAAYVLHDAGARVLLVDELAQWEAFGEVRELTRSLVRVITIQGISDEADDLVRSAHDWLHEAEDEEVPPR